MYELRWESDGFRMPRLPSECSIYQICGQDRVEESRCTQYMQISRLKAHTVRKTLRFVQTCVVGRQKAALASFCRSCTQTHGAGNVHVIVGVQQANRPNGLMTRLALPHFPGTLWTLSSSRCAVTVHFGVDSLPLESLACAWLCSNQSVPKCASLGAE